MSGRPFYDPMPSVEMLPRFDLDELYGEPPPDRDWIIPGFIPAGEVTLFTGPGGAGKSLFAQQLATCVAAQLPFLTLPTIELGSGEANVAAYVTAEDDTRELHRRQCNIMAAIDCDRDLLGDRLFLSSLRGRLGNELVSFDRDGEMTTTATFNLLRETIFATGAELVILDNVAHLFPGNENSRGEVTRFVNALYSLCRTYGTTILLVAHPNKSGDAYSGSTAWLNAVRSQIEIARVADELGHEADPDARVLRLGKANYARHGQTIPFRWHNFAFWHDDSLPDDLRDQYASLALANSENAAFMRCLEAATTRRKAVSENPGVNYYATVFRKMPEGKATSKAAFERAFERLLSIGAIELDARLWQRENRAWKYGIRAIEKCTDPLHRPRAPTRTAPSVNSARTDPPYTTYKSGAPTEAAAPSLECLEEGADR